jgi:hypothetical protein
MVAGLRMNTTNAWAAFDIMEEKVIAMEAEVRGAGVRATHAGLTAGRGIQQPLPAVAGPACVKPRSVSKRHHGATHGFQDLPKSPAFSPRPLPPAPRPSLSVS